jgi:O-antigen ligase
LQETLSTFWTGYPALALLTLAAAGFLLAVTAMKPRLAILLYCFSLGINDLHLFGGSSSEVSVAKIAGAWAILIAGVHFLCGSRQTRMRLGTMDVLVLSYLCVASLSAALTEGEAKADSVIAATLLAELVLMYFAIRLSIRDVTGVRWVAMALVLGATVAATLALARFFTGTGEALQQDLLGVQTSRIAGGPGDPNYLAQFLATNVPLALYLYSATAEFFRKLVWIAAIGILFAGTVVTFSRGGMMALAGGTIVWLLLTRKDRMRRLAILSAIALAVILVMGEQFSTLGNYLGAALAAPTAEGVGSPARVSVYPAAAKMILDHPVLGVGMYGFLYQSENYGGPHNVAHNMLLEVGTGMGLTGLGLFLLILVGSLRDLWRRRRLTLRGVPECATGVFSSCLTFLLAGMFLSSDIEKILWVAVALPLSLAGPLRRAARPSAARGVRLKSPAAIGPRSEASA